MRKGELDSLEYWEYDKLGTYASAGCVRLKVEDAKWIFDNCRNGSLVEFFSSSDVGPLGKPSAKKISSYEDYLRNWDPTDPNPNNPWKTYKAPTPTPTSTPTPMPTTTPTSTPTPTTSPVPTSIPTPSLTPIPTLTPPSTNTVDNTTDGNNSDDNIVTDIN